MKLGGKRKLEENIRREREETRRAEELERERTLRAERLAEASAAVQRQVDQQETFAEKQFDQQVALLTVQAELGEEAARLHREELNFNKKRGRAIASIPNLMEGEDVESSQLREG